MKSWFALTASSVWTQQATPLTQHVIIIQPLNNETTLNVNKDEFCPRLQL